MLPAVRERRRLTLPRWGRLYRLLRRTGFGRSAFPFLSRGAQKISARLFVLPGAPVPRCRAQVSGLAAARLSAVDRPGWVLRLYRDWHRSLLSPSRREACRPRPAGYGLPRLLVSRSRQYRPGLLLTAAVRSDRSLSRRMAAERAAAWSGLHGRGRRRAFHPMYCSFLPNDAWFLSP